MDSVLKKHKWTKEEESVLVEMWPTSTHKEIAAILNLPPRVIKKKREQLNLRAKKPLVKIGRTSPGIIPTGITELSYIAGIIDGEGHIGITYQKPRNTNHNPHYRALLMVQGADRRMTDFLFEHCGGYLRVEQRLTKRNKPVHRWYIDGDDSVNILMAIYPYLVCKKDQVDLLIKFRQSFSIAYNRLPRELVEFRHECYVNLRQIHAGLGFRGLQFPELPLPRKLSERR